MSPQLPPLPREPVRDARLEQLREVEVNQMIFGVGTVLSALAWIWFRHIVPFQIAFPIVGYLAIEAFKAHRRAREWRRLHPHEARMHPDRVQQIEQETVRVMSDIAKSRAWFTRAIVGCVALPTILQIFVGLERSVELASVSRDPILGGDWWRLLSGTYPHGSYYHFTGNMGALLVYGSILESKTSRARLPLVYLLACLAGSVATILLPPYALPSIGASGGVVGVIGFLWLFSRRQAVHFPAAFRGATASVFVGLITAGALGFWYIDNAGHAGGALMGILVAGLAVDTARNFSGDIEMPLLDLLGWASAIAIVGGSLWTSAVLLGMN
jgi:membrane associated rhomboid family serine protease